MFFPHFKPDVRGCTMAKVSIDLKSTITPKYRDRPFYFKRIRIQQYAVKESERVTKCLDAVAVL